MTSKADISATNWAALVAAAPAIARAVSSAAGSAAQSERELDAFIRFVGDPAPAAAAGLLDELVRDVAASVAAGVAPPTGDVYAAGLEAARRAGAIIAVEATPEEAIAVRAWYLAVASRVAEAAREGGLLGVGGEQVSEWERETIRSIADALGAADAEA